MANITSSGGFKPSTTDTPLDIRTRVNTYEEIKNIPNPYIGMEILVLTDENNEGRKTKYKVESLKSNDLGLENTLIDINTLKKIETYEVNLEELINLSKRINVNFDSSCISILLCGKSGVGKTLLAKVYGESLVGDNIIKLKKGKIYMTLYVFDMDGTLTPARKPMTEDFKIKRDH